MNVQEEISKYLLSHDTVNVVIAGTTCSGKTTLANEIRNHFSDRYSVTLVAQDDYFKNLPDIPRIREGYLTDSIEAFGRLSSSTMCKSCLQMELLQCPGMTLLQTQE